MSMLCFLKIEFKKTVLHLMCYKIDQQTLNFFATTIKPTPCCHKIKSLHVQVPIAFQVLHEP
jgi:hypothetical protein